MRTCEWYISPNEICGNLVEGRTNTCATHGALSRKLARDAAKKIAKEQLRIEKAKVRNLEPKKGITVKDLKDSNLWVPFSKYIRLRDSDEFGICTCFTCGRKLEWNSGMQAGHFIGRRHWATRYHEKNVHAQCPTCNMYQSGMQFEYGKKLDLVYGTGTSDELYELSRQTIHLSQNEIDDLAAVYRGKVREQLARLATQKEII